jgi:hypothetical protein
MSRSRERTVFVRLPSASAAAALLSNGSAATLLASGVVPADSPPMWPLVVLALGSMAYDLGVRALQRTDK